MATPSGSKRFYCVLLEASIASLCLTRPSHARDPALMRSEQFSQQEIQPWPDAILPDIQGHALGDPAMRQEQAVAASGSSNANILATEADTATSSAGASTREGSREGGVDGERGSAAAALAVLAGRGGGSAAAAVGVGDGRGAVARQEPGAGGAASLHALPRTGSQAVPVSVAIRLRKLHDIDLGARDWTADVELTLVWSDPLAASSASVTESSGPATLTAHEAQALFWLPDVSILYKTEHFMLSAVVNVTASGQVTLTQRILLSVTQIFKESRYPYDVQTLVLKIASRSYSARTLALLPALNGTAHPGVSDDFIDDDAEWQYLVDSFELKAVLVNDGLIRRSTVEAQVKMKRKSRTFASGFLMPDVLSVVVSLSAVFLPFVVQLATIRVVMSLSACVAAIGCVVLNVDAQLGYEVLTWLDFFKEACAFLAVEALLFNLLIEVTADKFAIDVFTSEAALTARALLVATTALSIALLVGAAFLDERGGLLWGCTIVHASIALSVGFFIFWLWHQARKLIRAVEEIEDSTGRGDADTPAARAGPVQAALAAKTAAARGSGRNLEVSEGTRGWRRGNYASARLGSSQSLGSEGRGRAESSSESDAARQARLTPRAAAADEGVSRASSVRSVQAGSAEVRTEAPATHADGSEPTAGIFSW